jgi:GT2 family glycosyltransferase
MNISIIISTYNREKTLCSTLSNIISFERQYKELIVVDQTKEHESETKQFLDNLVSNNKIKYIYVDYPNLPNARNAGINNSCGDIVLFFDDDVEINEDTIPSHVSGFSDTNTGCVTGKVIVKNADKSENIVFKNTGTFKSKLKSLFFFFLRKKASYVGRLGILSNFSGEKRLPADSCIGCNMSFRKEVFSRCGLFDANYTGSAVREDTDMSVRLRKSGFNIIYNPRAAVIHYMENSGGTRAVSSETYWRTIFKNQCYFYLKNFHYSKLNIYFIQFFDILKCRKSGINTISILKKSYNDAKMLLS